MKLFLVSQNHNNNYDTFDSFVCAAKNENQAKNISPYGKYINWEKINEFDSSSWVDKKDKINVKYIGEASPEYTKRQIICASFNAG